MYAGSNNNESNYSYYLYTAKTYWTMSPMHSANGYDVYSLGRITAGSFSNSVQLVPVLSLISETKISSGTGTYDNPYVVSIN